MRAALQPASSASACSTSYAHTSTWPRASVRSTARNVVLRATGNFQDTTSKFARDANSEFQKFSKKHDFESLAKKAQKKAQEAFQEVQEATNRTYVKLDSEYSISDKAAKAARKAEEAAKDLDQKYSVRRKLRSTIETVQRKWPIWQKQFDEFGATWYGKVVIIGGVFLLFSSAFFWKLMNFVLLLWWLSIPLSFFLIEAVRKQQQERMQQEAEARQRAANPFADMFRQRASSQASGFGASSSSNGRRQQDGPVIEAEWTSIDEGDSPRRK